MLRSGRSEATVRKCCLQDLRALQGKVLRTCKVASGGHFRDIGTSILALTNKPLCGFSNMHTSGSQYCTIWGAWRGSGMLVNTAMVPEISKSLLRCRTCLAVGAVVLPWRHMATLVRESRVCKEGRG